MNSQEWKEAHPEAFADLCEQAAQRDAAYVRLQIDQFIQLRPKSRSGL